MSSCESTEGKDFNSIVTPLQQIEEMPSKTWRHSTPEAQGIDSNQLAEMITYVKKQDKGLESITIIRNWFLISDAYFNPLYKPNRKHAIYSCTKSIIATLIGIALDQK